jgi:predicted transposase/invertase (TIGR01784 family)
MNQPHDAFVRSILSDERNAIDFFKTSLPSEISSILSLENLELTKETFISKKFKESRTDLLFKVPLQNSDSSIYIYLLFEHKSYYDPKIFFQLLEYLSKIYTFQQKNHDELRVVLPFVFYHGEKSWDLGNSFLDNFPNKSNLSPHLHKFIPNFSIQLFQLKSKSEEFLTDNLALKVYLRIIQIIRDEPKELLSKLREIFTTLSAETNPEKRIDIFQTLLDYLFTARKDSEDLLEKEIFAIMEDDFMNILERKKLEGKIEGEIKGKLEGRFELSLETAKKMREEGDSIEKIIRITGLTEAQLRENGIF